MRNELPIIDGMSMEVKRGIIPVQLQKQILQQLFSNHMGIEKTRLLACESVYWLNINASIQNFMKQYATCLDY